VRGGIHTCTRAEEPDGLPAGKSHGQLRARPAAAGRRPPPSPAHAHQLKGLEDVRQALGRDADAGVGHGHTRALILGLSRDVDGAGGGAGWGWGAGGGGCEGARACWQGDGVWGRYYPLSQIRPPGRRAGPRPSGRPRTAPGPPTAPEAPHSRRASAKKAGDATDKSPCSLHRARQTPNSPLRPRPRRSPAVREARRVAQQVEQHLHQPRAVGLDGRELAVDAVD
jgi:hypothetical protein